jgi:hypothetical protein
MTLRIERVSRGQVRILRLSGRLQSEHLKDLEAQTGGSPQKVVLDLEQVKLVDQEAVRFLAACETTGVQLTHCSPYIRDWINREEADRGRSDR